MTFGRPRDADAERPINPGARLLNGVVATSGVFTCAGVGRGEPVLSSIDRRPTAIRRDLARGLG